ncbi:peptidoglycan editing factor PgeF [Methylocella tundrae]|uniref:Purine nucleoside phosphorylase n=1 Tax=Methylocella tundrae TaxID=227605 RepID=A0A4U8YXX7_METTU|nr:peptidoglycan editing factor PgeF [Methylocella tundrae]WPP05228.1 peptidoglycan editing factor PgeF [Methylocella tundrae]VFU07572.1 Polyphenol oxidase [Methylocella tundrae]
MDELKADALFAPVLQIAGVSHGFFTRRGGVSSGVYASLNGGVGSRDAPETVAENRRRMAAVLRVDAERLIVPYQVHSPDVLVISGPVEGRPHCDGLVTSTPGVALGVTGADCGMILFADAKARVIGAAHAGWKGALTGVLEATLFAMEGLGASRSSIIAALGPAIGQNSYEVGPEFYDRFVETAQAYADFFRPSQNWGRFMFDLPAFIALRLRQAGVGAFEDLGRDTYAEPEQFFSYRRSVHRQEPDYGRQISAIALV